MTKEGNQNENKAEKKLKKEESLLSSLSKYVTCLNCHFPIIWDSVSLLQPENRRFKENNGLLNGLLIDKITV